MGPAPPEPEDDAQIVVSVTDPEKPLRLVRVRLETEDEPALKDSVVGLAVRLKSRIVT